MNAVGKSARELTKMATSVLRRDPGRDGFAYCVRFSPTALYLELHTRMGMED